MPEIDCSRPLLAIDSGTSVLSLVVRAAGKTHLMRENLGNRQSEALLPALRALLVEAGVQVSDVAAIIYNQGPGMFTGLRIGIGVAQGLAAPFAIPLIGVPSLDATASLLPDCPYVLAAVDARMGEVFYAWFDTRNHTRLSAYAVDKAENITLPASARLEDAQGIGNAFVAPVCKIHGTNDMPDAGDFLHLGISGRYPAQPAAMASLLYVRDKIALTAAEQAAARAAAQ